MASSLVFKMRMGTTDRRYAVWGGGGGIGGVFGVSAASVPSGGGRSTRELRMPKLLPEAENSRAPPSPSRPSPAEKRVRECERGGRILRPGLAGAGGEISESNVRP